MNATLSSLDVVETGRSLGLTFRKLDYWCHRGIFGEHNIAPGAGNGRRFTPEDLKVALVLARVSRAVDAWTGGRGGFAPIYREIAQGVRTNVEPVVTITAGRGIELRVDLVALQNGDIHD